MEKQAPIKKEIKKDGSIYRVIIIGLLILIGITIIIIIGQVNKMNTNVITIYDRFVDVNSDGLVDLIKRADVVLNTGELNFLPSQPTLSP